MKWEFVNVLLIAAVMGGGCSRGGGKNSRAEGDGVNPDDWRPSADAIAAVKRDKQAPMIVARVTQPRASDYDLNPRATSPSHQDSSASPPNEEASDADPMFGGMEKLPPPPMPKVGSGDEADQFGLPEWEHMARGELHVKRIRY